MRLKKDRGQTRVGGDRTVWREGSLTIWEPKTGNLSSVILLWYLPLTDLCPMSRAAVIILVLLSSNQ